MSFQSQAKHFLYVPNLSWCFDCFTGILLWIVAECLYVAPLLLNTSYRWCGCWKPWQRGKPGSRERHHRTPSSPSHPTVSPHTPGQGDPGAGQQWPGHTHAGTDLRTPADTDGPLVPLVYIFCGWFIYFSLMQDIKEVEVLNIMDLSLEVLM